VKPWIIYSRVSTDKQSERGASLEAQLAACTALATAHGNQTIHIADAGESAGAVDQPGIKKILDLVDAGKVAGVLVYKLDRIARNTRGLLDLVERFSAQGVHFTSVQERIDTSGASGRLILTVLAALAQFEREQLIERIKATNDYRRSEGAWVGGTPPAGLTIERRGKLRFLVPHPKHAVDVAQVWPAVLVGRSLAEVAANLQQAGVPTSMGKRRTKGVWARNTVEHLVKNRRYIGILVSAEDFERAAAMLTSRLQRPSARAAAAASCASRIWRLQGVAKCARCGSGMTNGGGTGRGGVVYHYLRCTGRMRHGRAFCPAKDLPAQPWEDKVVAKLAKYLSNKAGLLEDVQRAISRRLADAAPLRERVRELELARDGIREQVDRALELALQGGATARAVGPRLGMLQADLEAAEVALAGAQGRLAGAELPIGSMEMTAALLAQGGEDLPSWGWEDQQGAIRVLLEEARLGAGVKSTIAVRIPNLVGTSVGSQSASQVVDQMRHALNHGPPLATIGCEVEAPERLGRGWFKRAAGGCGPEIGR
jgi:site-specific DNA recombinase